MRSIWTGTLGWNMITIPVKLGTAVSDGGLELHQFRKGDGSRIRFRRTAEADGADVEYGDVRKGYELGSGQVVLLEDADFELAYGAKTRQAVIQAFVPGNSAPRLAAETSYYVQPDKNGDRAYALLAEAMKRTGKAAVMTIAVRQREAMGLLYATEDGYLVLERLHWASEVKRPDFAAPRAGLTEAGIDLAENLITQMSGTFNWAAFEDTSAQALMDVIQAKAETGQVTGTPPAAVPGAATPPGDIMAALEASVAAAVAARAPAPVARRPRARKAVTAARAAA